MQRKYVESSDSEVRACKFCGRRSCKIGLSEVPQRARFPMMQQPSTQPSTENVLGGLRQLTLQQAQQEKSTTSNLHKPSQAHSTSARSERVLQPEPESSEMESTEDTGLRCQRGKHDFSSTTLKLLAKLSPPPFVLTISVAILAILISYLHTARNLRELPTGTCYWHQSSLINNNVSPICHFEVRDPKFLDILGQSPMLESIAHTDAQGGGIYLPDFNELYYSTPATKRGLIGMQGQNSEVKKVSLTTRKVTTVLPVTDVASGMSLDLEGNLLICEQGQGEKGGYIHRLDLKRLNSTVVADNWFGVPFNSPNDVVIKRDGSIWFTDTTHGWVKGFRPRPLLQNQIYRVAPRSGIVDAVADGFTLPNGLAFSGDEKLLYITDGGYTVNGKRDEVKSHHIYVFSVYSDGSLGSRRTFAAVGVYDAKTQALGVPNGIKVDNLGNIYIGSTDGVQVFDHKGKALGLIRIPGVTNLGFGGDFLNKLFILNGSGIYCIELKAVGVGLHYASRRRNLRRH